MTRAAIKHNEERLRAAMLASDVPTLDLLIDDALLFSTPDGKLARKEDDLKNHREGAQKVTKADAHDLVIELHGEDIAIATVLVDLELTFHGETFAGTYRYVRTWRKNDEGVWRVVAGAVTAAP